MQHLATTRRFAAVLLLALPGVVAAQAWQIHDSGDAQFGVSDIGFLGAAANVPGGPGHVFGGTNGIFEGQLIVGLSETQVCGEAYAGSTVCAPSRCALMTGLHTGHCRTRGNGGARRA